MKIKRDGIFTMDSGIAEIAAFCLFSRSGFPSEDWSNCMVSLLARTGDGHFIKA